jgi:hypothetical protein
MPAIADGNVDRATIEHVLKLLENRLEAVATCGASGCPTCHDAELRGAIQLLRRERERDETRGYSVRATRQPLPREHRAFACGGGRDPSASALS